MVDDKSDFQRLSDYLMTLSVGVGIYPIQMFYEFVNELIQNDEENPVLHFSAPNDVRQIYKNMTEKDEAAFLIYFGSECLKRLEE